MTLIRHEFLAMLESSMADVFSRKKRSKIMAAIKSKNTGFEVSFLKLLSAKIYPLGFRYRKHYRKIVGNPDIVFVKHKVAVFLDSDFWHGRNFRKLRPRLRSVYWVDKITRNMKRDLAVTRALRRIGWRVIRLGESEIKRNPAKAVGRVRAGLRG